MKTSYAIAAALIAASGAVQLARAQPADSTATQANPNLKPFNAAAATPALTYQSPIDGFAPLREPAASPSQNWQAVNQAVGSYDSMAITFDAAPETAQVSAPAATDSQPAAKPKPQPEAHQHGHINMHAPMGTPAETKKGGTQ